jgi:acyl transferase domain-containing protein/3-hydroxymyristoyl/3-hydroxydecanoyl-(acyl carrier protein) dehydratase
MSTSTERIAIVSFAGRFPGSGADLAAFWENVSGAVDCASEVAPNRWVLPPDRCTDPRIANPDTVYSTRGYYLDPFTPDLSNLALNPEVVSYLDPLFQLVLDVGNRAWWGAKTEKIDRSRVGVVLGNICLPTEKSSDLCRDILGPQLGLSGGYVYPLNRYVAGMPAGLLATGLGLGGGSYTLDAACASSLYAIKLAADELLAGRADAMLAGGCSRPDCQYTQMGFAQLRALSVSGRCSPFDASADGLMVGEGAGIFVLKRLADALKQGDTIHAVLAGVGLSNDMHGNLLAPAKEGQLRAMRKAYERAGWKPQDVQLIECHATGTPVGDAVEFDSLRELWGATEWTPGQCVIGSVKSTVGHLLTGAGAAAVIKVLLAMKTETLPPQANFSTPATGLLYAGEPFRVLQRPEVWSRRVTGEPRRAAVSGFGFGGVNAHVLLEEWTRLRSTKKEPVRSGEARKLVLAEPKADDPVAPKVRKSATPVAVVGLAAHFGPWDDLRKFQEHVLSGEVVSPGPKTNGWALANEPCPPSYGIEEFSLPIDRFRIPPKELEEALPQQLLMLKVAAAALDDAAPSSNEQPRGNPAEELTTGCFIGLGLDPNTTNFNLRWSCLAQQMSSYAHQENGRTGDQENAGEDQHGLVSSSPVLPFSRSIPLPPLTANRTMGALGSIAASRIARAFHFGGPSHTVCSEEGSAARAVELGVRALRAGELDRVLVGGVDLACDPRTVLPGGVALPGEGAAAFVLKRLADAKRDGDRVYAVIRGVGVASNEQAAISRAIADADKPFDDAFRFEASAEVGQTGAASAAASLAKAVLALWQEVLPGSSPRYWLQDRATGRRQAAITAAGADGSHFAILLEEHSENANLAPIPERWQPLGARTEAVFVADADTHNDVLAKLDRLRELTGPTQNTPQRPKNIEAVARAWFRDSPPGAGKFAVSLVARSVEELNEQIKFATEALAANTRDPFPVTAEPALRDRVFYSPRPYGPKGKLAFVFPGSGNHFDGMGRDLSPHWPEVLRRQQRENELLRSQYAPDFFWDERSSEATPRRFLFGQVSVGSLVSDILMSLGVKCDAMIGLSLGESAGLFGVRAWQHRDEMYKRIRNSTLFVSDLAPPYAAARLHWHTPRRDTIDWVIGIVSCAPDEMIAAQRPGLRAYLLMVNTPTECVIGGQRADVEKLVTAIGKTLTLLNGVTLAHCEVAKPVETPYRELHTLPVTAPAELVVYSGAWGKSYKPGEKQCADSITAGLLNTIDVPNLVRAAYRDGVKVFVEIGPGSSCVRIIESILGERPYLARSAHAAKQDAVSQILRLVANLAAERIPVDLSPLYGCDSVCVAHREPAPKSAKELVIPVGRSPSSELSDSGQPLEEDDAQSGRHTQSLSANDTQSNKPKQASSVERVQSAVPVPSALAVAVAADSDMSEPYAEDTPTLPQSMAETTPTQLVATIAPVLTAAANIRVLTTQAQAIFQRLHEGYTETAASLLQFQTQLMEALARQGGGSGDRRQGAGDREQRTENRGQETENRGQRTEGRSGGSQDPPRALTFEQCCTFATGRVAAVLGPRFAEIDSFPTRVRLPDGPLQLVDRITRIEGEPLSITPGRVVTEHAVRADRWYLEAGRIPTALAVEAGQADLFLSGFLGIDLQTRGLAVYRLLDAIVSFHRGLPAVGETVVYDIHIDEFVKQGEVWLFRFRFDGTVNGEPFITMRNGVAGFFTAEALAAGKGIVQTALDKQPVAGKLPADWRNFVEQKASSLSAKQVEALRTGDLVAAFGSDFARVNLRKAATLPGAMLNLVNRVPVIDPTGGRFGLGFVRAEFNIHPADWFLTCHFVDDMVMPGTLMYECCLHTLRVFLMRQGWLGEDGEVVCEPVPGVQSRLKCRGQVIASTKVVTYEVTVKELGYGPEPYCFADALMYADGKPIVEITNMSLRMSGLTREKLEAIWAESGTASGRVDDLGRPWRAGDVSPPVEQKPHFHSTGGLTSSARQEEDCRSPGAPLYDSSRILAFSNGNPSEAFGEPYRVFDHDRVIARLPGPPYQFLDCITAVTGAPFVMKGGASCEAKYEVPETAWYFTANRGEKMPFSVLLEIGLQPCGWLAAYCGSALTSPEDLSFRNLGGKATQLRAVTPAAGMLTTNVKLTNVSASGGMIIQHYDMRVSDSLGVVYEGTTYFGFFSKKALADQVGIRDAKVPWPTATEKARVQADKLPRDAPFPGPMLRMIDRVEYIPDGGKAGLGLVVGKIAVNPSFWFFGAHFYQDPVWPGSLGLESFLQLLKFMAWKRWKDVPEGGYQAVALNSRHEWVYRGQVLPSDKEVQVVLEITGRDDSKRRLTANGFLVVDRRVIYQMTDFTLE